MDSETTTPLTRPVGICTNCWVVWRAKRPRPAAVYCHHFGGNAARWTAAGWKVLEAVSAKALAVMRAEGLL